MAVWNWYMTRAMRERLAIVAGIVVLVVLVIGTISSLTDEDGDGDEDDADEGIKLATADYGPETSLSGQKR